MADIVISYFLREFFEIFPIFQGNFLKNFLFFNGILSMSVYSTMRWDIFCLDVMIF